MPSVLLELGYLTNKEDEKRLMSKAWRERTSTALAAAIDKYFSKRVARVPY